MIDGPRRRRTVAIALVLVVAAIAQPGPVRAALPQHNGKIVFSGFPGTDDNNGIHIYSINPDGSGLKQLTFGSVWDGSPRWSPDGTRIAFSRAPVAVDHADIWVMNSDGSGTQRLTTSGHDTDYAFNATPYWSPDGSRLVWTEWWKDFNGLYTITSVRTMAANGSDVQTIAGDRGMAAPSWSPDGALIAFPGSPFEGSGLYVVEPDGSNRVLLYPEWEGAATDWSPDGQWMLSDFDAASDLGIWKMPRSGGTPIDLAAGHAELYQPIHPVYSPDGGWIAVNVSTQVGGCEVATMQATGAGTATTITGNTSLCANEPDWQPSIYPFVDILDSPFRADIAYVAGQGITSGCATLPDRYCPNGNVTRGQMASFLARALDLPSSASDYFSDDETSIHETDINRVAKAGITSGCTATTYCPLQPVTRGQMASFLARGFSLPSSATDYFSDDETSIHQTDINRVAKAGITSGCTATTYCPLQPVTRGQMAAFLHRALD